MHPMIQRTYLPTLGGLQYSGFDTSYHGEQKWELSILWPSEDRPRLKKMEGWLLSDRPTFTKDFFSNLVASIYLSNIFPEVMLSFFKKVEKDGDFRPYFSEWLTDKDRIESSTIDFDTQKMVAFLQQYNVLKKQLHDAMADAYIQTIHQWSKKSSSINFEQWLTDAKARKSSPTLMISPETAWTGAFSLQPGSTVVKNAGEALVESLGLQTEPVTNPIKNAAKKALPFAVITGSLYLVFKVISWYDQRQEDAISSELRMRQLAKLREEQEK